MSKKKKAKKEVEVEVQVVAKPAPSTIVSPQVVSSPSMGRDGLRGRVVRWEGITEHSVLAPYCVANYANKSIQINGNLGSGSFDVYGSNCPEGNGYSVLSDGNGDNLAALGNKIKEISPHTYWVKPVRMGGSGMLVDITMILFNNK